MSRHLRAAVAAKTAARQATKRLSFIFLSEANSDPKTKNKGILNKRREKWKSSASVSVTGGREDGMNGKSVQFHDEQGRLKGGWRSRG